MNKISAVIIFDKKENMKAVMANNKLAEAWLERFGSVGDFYVPFFIHKNLQYFIDHEKPKRGKKK